MADDSDVALRGSPQSEFLPCPFCGEGERLTTAPGSAQHQTFTMCGRCGASGPLSWGRENNALGAIAAWNRRAVPSPTWRDGIEAAAKAIEAKHTNNVGMVHPMAISDAAAIRALSPPDSERT